MKSTVQEEKEASERVQELLKSKGSQPFCHIVVFYTPEYETRARWHEHGEKNSKYFLNLEKRNHVTKHVRKLHISGVISTDRRPAFKL